jgi:hypothetical protein
VLLRDVVDPPDIVAPGRAGFEVTKGYVPHTFTRGEV